MVLGFFCFLVHLFLLLLLLQEMLLLLLQFLLEVLLLVLLLRLTDTPQVSILGAPAGLQEDLHHRMLECLVLPSQEGLGM